MVTDVLLSDLLLVDAKSMIVINSIQQLLQALRQQSSCSPPPPPQGGANGLQSSCGPPAPPCVAAGLTFSSLKTCIFDQIRSSLSDITFFFWSERCKCDKYATIIRIRTRTNLFTAQWTLQVQALYYSTTEELQTHYCSLMHTSTSHTHPHPHTILLLNHNRLAEPDRFKPSED